MLRDFYAGFATCLIEECYLNCAFAELSKFQWFTTLVGGGNLENIFSKLIQLFFILTSCSQNPVLQVWGRSLPAVPS